VTKKIDRRQKVKTWNGFNYLRRPGAVSTNTTVSVI